MTEDMQAEIRDELTKLDHEEQNNERKHKFHRDGMDITIADRDPEAGEAYPRTKLLKLSRCEDWLESIFSKSYKDLHHLVENSEVSAAIRKLTDKQKQVLHLNIVEEYTIQDIAAMLGTTGRNVRKHREKALDFIRQAVSGNSGEGYVGSVAVILGWVVIPTFMIGWEISKRVYPSVKHNLIQKAA
jgi:DNA-directed RNA polymerase specialized sigma subunit, sigma24 homolog